MAAKFLALAGQGYVGAADRPRSSRNDDRGSWSATAGRNRSQPKHAGQQRPATAHQQSPPRQGSPQRPPAFSGPPNSNRQPDPHGQPYPDGQPYPNRQPHPDGQPHLHGQPYSNRQPHPRGQPHPDAKCHHHGPPAVIDDRAVPLSHPRRYHRTPSAAYPGRCAFRPLVRAQDAPAFARRPAQTKWPGTS
jgi:hypothetical protein